jgi:ribosomal protein S17E
MARIQVAMSNEAYNQFKNEVLEQKVLRRVDVSSENIDFDSLTGISINGTLIKLEKKALTSLTKSLGLSKMFFDTVESAFDTNKEVLARLIKAVKDKKSKRFTLVYNNISKSVTHVYPAGTKLISDHQYFETLEKVIARTPGAFLRSLVQDPNGDISATLANPLMEFDFNKVAEESFIGGMTLALTTKKMYTSFFTERLVCTNGMVTQDKLCSVSVDTKNKVPDFMAAILDSDYHIKSIGEFKKRLNRCYHTTASLNEVLLTERSLRGILGDNAMADGLLSEMSSTHLKTTFGPNYLENTDIHKFLNTDLTLWELVNEITAISAAVEQRGLAVTEKDNLQIQILGGNRMFSIPDLPPNTIKQIFK